MQANICRLYKVSKRRPLLSYTNLSDFCWYILTLSQYWVYCLIQIFFSVEVITQSLSNLYLLTQSALWLQRLDLNQRPLGYEPSELPNCYHSAIYLFDNLQTNIMIVSCRKPSYFSLTVVLQNSRRRKISLNINDTHNHLCKEVSNPKRKFILI